MSSYNTSAKLNLSKVRERSKGYVSSKEALRGTVCFNWSQAIKSNEKGFATTKTGKKRCVK